jgi:hypothetical protein
MHCPRCAGLLLPDLAADLRSGERADWLWACLLYGNRLDAVILNNGRLREAGLLSLTRQTITPVIDGSTAVGEAALPSLSRSR